MPRYVAFLRAINVGGRTVKMTRLRQLFEELGLAQVETFIASGNVIFRSRSVKPGALEKTIEQQLRRSLGFEVSTLIRSTSELSAIVGLRAFPDTETPTSSLYVGLLKSAPGDAEREKVLALGTPTDEFRVEGRELYWLCRTKSMESVVSGARLEKSVGMPATFRNVSTLRKLAMKYCIGVALACVLAGGVTSTGAQTSPPSGQSRPRMETGFLDRTIAVNGKTYRYQVFVPATYLTTRPWPVILFLHGAGERGNDGILQTQVGIGRAIRENSSRFPAIVVIPQSPPDSAWTGSVAQFALNALDQTTREFQTDPRRIYLTGLSMGGNGVWYIAYRNPSRFAAIPVVPAADGPPFDALARRLRNVPTWIFHGEIDDAVPVDHSRKAAAALHAAGTPVQYTELPGIGHNSWDAAYGSPSFWTWLFAQVKPAPAGVPTRE